jgi:hypothetical protein
MTDEAQDSKNALGQSVPLSVLLGVINMIQHYSDCALHDFPARYPMPCNCGVKYDTRHEKLFDRLGYTLALRLQSFYLLWLHRIFWKRENHETLGCFLLTVAKHSALSRYLSRSQANEAQRRE